jgi:cystathionine beta-lyase
LWGYPAGFFIERMTKIETKIATLGTGIDPNCDIVNLPPYRASTILFRNAADLQAADRGEFAGFAYGRYGTPSSAALEEAIAALCGADHAIVTSSGLSAIVLALTAFLKSGDHLLMTDAVYGPTRKFCDHVLARMGVETTYYDPLVGSGITSLIKKNTKIVYVESPGSQTFEVQDIPAITKAAHAKGALVVGDLTWATPLYINGFALGVDIVMHSVTKYMAGHSDLVMGVLAYQKPHHDALIDTYHYMGLCPAADNCYLALRGLRTLPVRIKQQFENAMTVAAWLKKRPEVEEVLFPPLPGAPGHDTWKRDFSGGSSLFSIALKPVSPQAVAAMIDKLEYFGLGYSWGGFESLITAFDLRENRKARAWPYKGTGLRLHIGLEHPDDLIRDLEAGFKRLK